MKKLLATLLIGGLTMSLFTGCGSDKKDENVNTNQDVVENDVENDVVDVETEETTDNTLEDKDWQIPVIAIDGVKYNFPMEAQELVDNGWVMEDGFPFPARPGSNALVSFTKGDMVLQTNVSSATGVEVPMEEGEVCSLHFGVDYNVNIPVAFPGGITVGMTKEQLDEVIPPMFEYDAENFVYKFTEGREQGSMDIKVYLSDDGSTVEEIALGFWTR